MWNAKIYTLAILVISFSEFWPYIKLFLMLLCWIFPKWILSFKGRELFLLILDKTGKWSLLDAYVMF
jgi:uncharacterized paraquat-inducible protein A